MDKGILLAASYDLKVHMFQLSNGNETNEYDIPNSQANRIVVSKNQFYIAGYSNFFCYDIESKSNRAIQSVVAHESNVTDICISEFNIITCGEDKTIKVWDSRSHHPSICVSTDDSLNSMVLLNNGYEVIAGGEDGTISLWDLKNPRAPCEKKQSNSPVRSLSISPEGSEFLSSYMDGKTIKYKIENEVITEVCDIQSFNDIQLRCAISPNSEYFATSAANNCAKIYGFGNCEMRHSLVPNETRTWVWDVAFTPDSTKLCTGSSDGICRIWDVENGKMEMEIPVNGVSKSVSAIAVIAFQY
ncbi:WD repeat-containing protein wat1 [Histomonas meleagridis]|uniref:WD repeat-containing protein wat1 n=1 Tax=Histomonas meleagridis TaxID=135588 RepID=UPI0035598A87|nr:WD repeat-containing protein wat1 [Histomonas meleagridis]